MSQARFHFLPVTAALGRFAESRKEMVYLRLKRLLWAPLPVINGPLCLHTLLVELVAAVKGKKLADVMVYCAQYIPL